MFVVNALFASEAKFASFKLEAFAGGAQLTFRLTAACQVSQVLGPTTAIALTIPVVSVPRPVPAIIWVGTTAIIPAGVAGTGPFNVPPKAGLCWITA